MGTKANNKSTIPTGNHPFMDWLANFQIQILALIGVNAPDGEPYFYTRAVNRWNSAVQPGIVSLTALWQSVMNTTTRTTGQTQQFNEDKKIFLKTLLRPFNKEFVLYHSALTVQQKSQIGVLAVHDTQRTAASQTVEQLFAKWKLLGGCVAEFHCSTVSDSKIASTPEGKVVQMAFMFAPNPSASTVAPFAAPAASTVPATPQDCPRQDISTKALFRKDFSSFNINGTGGTLYIFFRWFDIHHAEKSGPWSQRYTIVMG